MGSLVKKAVSQIQASKGGMSNPLTGIDPLTRMGTNQGGTGAPGAAGRPGARRRGQPGRRPGPGLGPPRTPLAPQPIKAPPR